jgi:peptidoglycan hydrolase-like protein with peptidoglycan-binding domain
MNIPAAPDPYREGDAPFALDGEPTDEFEAFRELWRRGASLDALHPDGPFELRDPVGAYKPNRQGDVAKVQALLHDTGHLDANETDGPTGIYSRALLDAPIRAFQKDHGLKVDGILNPGGETIGKLQEVLGPHTGRDPFEALADDPDAAPSPGVPKAKGIQVADESAAGRAAARMAPFVASAIEMRRKMEEIARHPRSVESGPSGPPPSPAEPPFSPGEMQTPGTPAKPPIDPEEFNKESKPAEPIVVRGTVFPIPPDAGPQILISPDLSDELEQISIVENRRGNFNTQAQLDRLRDLILDSNPGWEHVAGGRDRITGKEKKEHWIPGLGELWNEDKRPGSNYVDLTFKTPEGKLVHFQTVDVDRYGNPTEREVQAARRIHHATHEDVFLVPKIRPTKRPQSGD